MLAIVLLLFTYLLHQSLSCPNRWHQSPLIHDYCYFVVAQHKSWAQAESYCNGLINDGHLVSISSAFENYNVQAVTIDTPSIETCNNFWIGASDPRQNGVFSWTNGVPFQYANWDAGQPDPSKPCTTMQVKTTGKWQTEVNGTLNCFICGFHNNSSPTTTTPSTTTVTWDSGKCPNGWSYFSMTNSCYKAYQQEPTIWYTADEYCFSQNTYRHLTSIHSMAENNFLVGLVRQILTTSGTQYIWIGLNDIASSSQFVWSDDSSYDFNNWAPGEPVQHPDDENCVVLTVSRDTNPDPLIGKWKDIPCGAANITTFICKIPRL